MFGMSYEGWWSQEEICGYVTKATKVFTERGVECVTKEEDGEVRSAGAQVLPGCPPVPRPPANRRALTGLDARQIVLLLILLETAPRSAAFIP